jgi:hypothetical protein
MAVLAITERHNHRGLHLVLAPHDAHRDEITAALEAAGVQPATVAEIENWQEYESGVMVAFMPYPQSN